MTQLTTAFSLLLGLGARILYNKFLAFRVPGIEDHVLSGLWQGVALYYVLMEFPFLTLPVGFGIGARLLVNFVVTYDAAGCACTLLGVAVGVLFTDILSQFLEDGDPEDAYYEGSVVSDYPRRRRLVQLRGSYNTDERVRDHNRRRRAFLEADPSVTTAVTNTTNTWDSLSDWIDPNHTMTPLEREVAALRKKASMADSERRRFKEEKQWAQVQGNKARAAQMGWQVKRYSALMQSFHREADLRLLEANNERHRQEVASLQASASQVAGPSSSMPLLPPPQPVAITVGGPGHRSAPSPEPRLIPPPEEERPLRSAIAKGKQPERRPRRVSTTTDKDGNPMKPGSVFTGMHHHRRAASVLSRPSVRIEVHETPSRRLKRA
ncbi:hypothetical protein B0F90DRAFT_1097483 [Multifurca ochricompacta]|uniref:Uncharacterized protein n=1 Tax=Multifurca ochricompacta TaxID=376703 RepID=A0AAD4MAQ2_9AGAM|nr:hypothetical protein B0F90DRAFT_1097483 [Multifurca ochricompacta]